VSYGLLRKGYDARYIIRAPHDEQFKKFHSKVLDAAHSRYVWDDPGTVVSEAVRFLKENAVMIIAGDQYSGSGTEIDFLGKPTLFTEGPLILALRSRAAIVPVFITRGPENIHTVSFEPELKFQEGAGFREKVRSALLELTRRLEDHIRQDPSQWLWLHRRWKNIKEVKY
jgi:lauroyl/myristoyl acyltransferase